MRGQAKKKLKMDSRLRGNDKGQKKQRFWFSEERWVK